MTTLNTATPRILSTSALTLGTNLLYPDNHARGREQPQCVGLNPRDYFTLSWHSRAGKGTTRRGAEP
jgi:hypothetical protein